MLRLLVCLPLCLLFAPSRPLAPVAVENADADATVLDDKTPLPNATQLDRLAHEKPLAFLEACLRRYQRDVKGYACNFAKHERVGGKLQDPEEIDVAFREQPYSVLFIWEKGARQAERTLFVEGENDGNMLARPAGRFARRIAGDVVSRDPDGREALRGGRYSIKGFGMKNGMARAYRTWKTAEEKGTLHVELLGEKRVKEAGDRLCYVVHRTKYEKPEEDGVADCVLYVDKETWLQVGSVLKDKDGDLIAEYYFRDIKLNPKFKQDQFSKAALTPQP
jgi:hypothetical protein